jgi:hypothetical protein
VSGRLAEELTRAVRDLSPLVTGADETLDGGGVDALASRVAAALARRGARPWEAVQSRSATARAISARS